jgi:hypothetical protein
VNEASVTIKWKHFIQSHPPKETETYELKFVDVSKGRKFSFDQVKDHQYLGLMTSLEGLWHKISDTVAHNGGSSKKPCDAIWVKARGAYAVIVFYKARVFTEALKIPIKDYIRIKNTWPKKSISMTDLEKQPGVEKYFI